jgi:hypothetical protein
VADEDLAVYAALTAGNVTNTGTAYAEYILTDNPSLRISPTNGDWLSLIWTPVAEHYLLRTAGQITTNQWTPLSFPLRDAGADFSTTVKETNSEEFFQLYLP